MLKELEELQTKYNEKLKARRIEKRIELEDSADFVIDMKNNLYFILLESDQGIPLLRLFCNSLSLKEIEFWMEEQFYSMDFYELIIKFFSNSIYKKAEDSKYIRLQDKTIEIFVSYSVNKKEVEFNIQKEVKVSTTNNLSLKVDNKELVIKTIEPYISTYLKSNNKCSVKYFPNEIYFKIKEITEQAEKLTK
jgi:hypothetical protein